MKKWIVTLLAVAAVVVAQDATAQETPPPNAQFYFNRGVANLNKGDHDQAIANFTQAIQLNPKFAQAYYDRGRTYMKKGDSDRAIADYTKAIQLNPKYAVAYNSRGLAYDRKGDADRAIADYNQAIQLDPRYAVAYNNRGNIYYTKGDTDRAIADFTEAVQLDPKLAVAYNDAIAAAKELTAITTPDLVGETTRGMVANTWPQIERSFGPRIDAATRAELRSEFEHLMQQFVIDGMQDLPLLYARYFTADELRQLVAFYKTPVGAKWMSQMPRIMAGYSATLLQRTTAFQQQLRGRWQAVLQKHGIK